MSTPALLLAALGLAVTAAAESKDFAAIEKEFKKAAEEAQRPLPSSLELISNPEPPRTRAPHWFASPGQDAGSDSPSRPQPVIPPEMKIGPDGTPHFPGGKAKRYTPERRGNRLPAPFEDFQMMRLGGTGAAER